MLDDCNWYIPCQCTQNFANQSRPIKLGPSPLITKSGNVLVWLLYMALTVIVPKIARFSPVYVHNITDDLGASCHWLYILAHLSRRQMPLCLTPSGVAVHLLLI